MSKLKRNGFVKFIAALLLIVSTGAALLGALSGYAMADCGAYRSSYEESLSSFMDNVGFQLTREARIYLGDNKPEEIMKNSGFAFKLYDADGNVLYDGVNGAKTIWSSDRQYIGEYAVVIKNYGNGYYVTEEAVPQSYGIPIPPENETEPPVEIDAAESEEKHPTFIQGYILALSGNSDMRIVRRYDQFHALYNYRVELVYAAIAAAVISLLLFAFLMAAAGCKPDGSVRGGLLCRIPFDIFTAAEFIAVFALAAVAVELSDVSYIDVFYFRLSISALCFVAAGIMTILWTMTWSVHIKLHDTIKSCLVWRILAWCWRLVKKPFGMAKELVKGLPLIPKAALIVAGVLLLEVFWMAICNVRAGLTLGWLIERAVLVVLTLYTLLCMKKLLAAGKAIADGDMNYKVDSAKMYGPLKEHAESLNNITAGLNDAVADRLKSERLRTELITNVSHDIKTPLTSIINYVDLLEKEEPENEKMRKYLEVLARQSARLKKLIEDLIEASKASTGNISVTPEKCTMNVLVDQMTGEYAEKLALRSLELIVSKPEQELCVMADGRHMWRIFDNLMNNICKYAQQGTRVYVDLKRREDKALVIFRNISASRLNVSGDELTERFVRGDAARSTEGSGLGLSIAQSLTKLQNGEMNITVDGDLFKVEIELPCVR